MRHVLAPASRAAVRRLAGSELLIAFDYDGTLAPIVARPERARMRPRTRALLTEVARRYPCAVISGRAERDVAARVRGTAVACVVGNHGVGAAGRRARFERDVKRWLPRLEAGLGVLAGVEIEDKGLSVSVHVRRSHAKRRALATVRALAAELGGVRLVGGKEVVNLLPDGAPHKGTALRAARARLGCQTALYVGDDDTDEDVFALAEPGLLTVRVERRRGSRAAYYVKNQREVDALLELLISFRDRRPDWRSG